MLISADQPSRYYAPVIPNRTSSVTDHSSAYSARSTPSPYSYPANSRPVAGNAFAASARSSYAHPSYIPEEYENESVESYDADQPMAPQTEYGAPHAGDYYNVYAPQSQQQFSIYVDHTQEQPSPTLPHMASPSIRHVGLETVPEAEDVPEDMEEWDIPQSDAPQTVAPQDNAVPILQPPLSPREFRASTVLANSPPPPSPRFSRRRSSLRYEVRQDEG